MEISEEVLLSLYPSYDSIHGLERNLIKKKYYREIKIKYIYDAGVVKSVDTTES